MSVRDDGVGLPVGRPLSEGVGLTATRARLRQYYGDDFTFALENRREGGVVCALTLPIRRAASEPLIEGEVVPIRSHA